jgi:predicted transcriptional regulator
MKSRYGGDDIKQVPIRLDDDLHKKLKIITIQKDTTIQEIVEVFLRNYVEQNQAK